ncbi:SCY1-like protein 2 [Homarus americanus]|uniref:SCY1-like protein 2 n=1 Tax=Homarus americanus TaxID=6706 RepID=UPI001C43C9DF|nr:SCY1-like protein 2 [Homarus americanus]
MCEDPPEIQTTSNCSVLSDMFSLGMCVCAIFNSGKSLIEANHSSSGYLKQLDVVGEQVNNVLPKIPLGLQEAVVRLVSRDSRQRPTSQLVALIKYFSDPTVHALQFLDVINMKDPTQKTHFYRTTLMEVLPHIPQDHSLFQDHYFFQDHSLFQDHYLLNDHSLFQDHPIFQNHPLYF